MNTFLSPEQQQLQAQYLSYVQEHIQPKSKALDDRTSSLKDLLVALGQKGYLAITVPKAYGGQEAPFLHTAFLLEAIGTTQMGLALAIAEHIGVIELLKKYGSDEQKSRYLPLLARGETIGALAFSEVSAGTDFKAIQSTARKDGSNYVIDGTKTWVVNGDLAGLAAVSARTADDGRLLLFLVDCNGSKAIKIGPNHNKMGMRSASTNDVEFASHVVPGSSAMAPDEDRFDDQVLYASEIAKTLIAAATIGMLQAALDGAVAHANSREQFGQKIGQFQAIQWKLADMSCEVSAARLITYRAAWTKDEEPANFRKDAAMCKWYAAKAARFHTAETTQIMGVAGVDADGDAERFYRDAKMTELCEGTSEFQKVVLAQELGI